MRVLVTDPVAKVTEAGIEPVDFAALLAGAALDVGRETDQMPSLALARRGQCPTGFAPCPVGAMIRSRENH